MRGLSRSLFVALGAVCLALPAGAAAAADQGADPASGASVNTASAALAPASEGGGGIYTGPTLSMTPFEKAHLAEVFADYMAMAGTKVLSDGEVLAEATRLGVRTQLQAEISSRTTSERVAAAAVPLSVVIGIKQEPQTKYYNCGAAAGTEIIKSAYFSSMASRRDGSAISQAAMGNANHMKTEANKVTSWASGNFVTGLNAWTGNTKHVYAQYTRPSATTMIAALTTVLTSGTSVAVDTVELQNGSHYNGHPNKKIGHWITAYYFGNYGNTVGFLDSTAGSTAVSGYGSAQAKFTADTTTFTNTYLQSNGAAF